MDIMIEMITQMVIDITNPPNKILVYIWYETSTLFNK